jgi:hypothetical protein
VSQHPMWLAEEAIVVSALCDVCGRVMPRQGGVEAWESAANIKLTQ